MPSAIRCEKAFGGFKITGSRTDIAKGNCLGYNSKLSIIS